MPEEMSPRFDHLTAEAKIYKLWEKSGYFNPDNLKLPKKAEPFCIVMPPPNANGALHIGHAVFVTIQDIMTRFARMRGKKTLWLPGADHAGFETQVVFDKKLEKEGRNRFAMNREELWREMWEFTQKNKSVMEGQLRKLGASCDWSREKFTLDPAIVEEVNKTFVKLYEDGLIYRDIRIVNWCPKHKTALSDLEVKYLERVDPLYYMKYGPLIVATVRPETKFGDTALAVNPKDKRYAKYIGKEIEAKGLLGPLKFKIIADDAVDPSFGTGVVKITPAHDSIDFEVWQRHKNEIAGPKIIIDENGRLTGETGHFKGLKIAEARMKVAEEMERAGMLEKVDTNYKHQIATCYKCGTTLEPLPRSQWFVKMQPLAKPAIDAVKSGKIKFYPDRIKKIYFHWLCNIRDWNISRQITWGIRIPAWFCKGKSGYRTMGFAEHIVPQILEKGKARTYRLREHNIRIGEKLFFENSGTKKIFGYGIFSSSRKTTVGAIQLPDIIHGGGYKTTQELIPAFKRHYPEKEVTPDTPAWIYDFEFKQDPEFTGCGSTIVSVTPLKKCPECGSSAISQDTDVFDTWFSSGQWPYLTLSYRGEESKVGSRKLKVKNDFNTFYPTDVMETAYDILFFWVARMVMLGLYRTGKIPFRKVYIHGLVRDQDRQKMSKSKGNVIDPLGVAELYGADAVRMALIAGNTAGNDIVISEDKIRGYRNFTTKIWNVARFISMNEPESRAVKTKFIKEDKKNLADLKKLKIKITNHLEKFEFHLASEKIYHYFWHTFADKIIEGYKPRLRENPAEIGKNLNIDPSDRAAAYQTLETILTECLKMLHPFMPFVTEEIYQKISNGKLLMVEKW